MRSGKKIYLVVSESGKRLMKKVLSPGVEYCIGRDRSISDIILENSRVSRKHCYIFWDGDTGYIWVKDISSNGCTLSGGKSLIREVYVKVKPGEEILITNTDYTLCAVWGRKRIWPEKQRK